MSVRGLVLNLIGIFVFIISMIIATVEVEDLNAFIRSIGYYRFWSPIAFWIPAIIAIVLVSIGTYLQHKAITR